MRAWKMVDAGDYAESFMRGSLKIGTRQGYKDLENGRQDSLDGGMQIKIDHLDSDNPAHSDAVGRLAERRLVIGPGRAELIDCTVEILSPPLYAFCLMESGCRYNPKPETKKRIFRIKHLGRLARRIQKIYADRIAGYEVNRVNYVRRTYQVHETSYGDASPFI